MDGRGARPMGQSTGTSPGQYLDSAGTAPGQHRDRSPLSAGSASHGVTARGLLYTIVGRDAPPLEAEAKDDR